MLRRTLLGLLGLLLVGSSAREAKRIIVPLPESAHPYTSNLDDTQTYTAPGAPANIWVTFDPLCETEAGYDFIYLFDGADSPVGDPAGYSGTELAGLVFGISGDTVKVQLVSDYDVQYWGYRITDVTATPPTLTVTPAITELIKDGLPKEGGAFLSLSATPALEGLTFSIETGALPTGLTLSSAGVFGGAPTVSGTFSVTVHVEDPGGASGSTAITIKVYPYPSPKIDPTETISLPDSAFSQHSGPYEYGGKLYGVFVDPVSGHVEIWASTDSGATWAEEDSGNHPALKNVAYFRGVGVHRVGDTLWLAYLVGGAPPVGYDARSGQITITSFSMASETWGSLITGGPWAELKAFDWLGLYVIRTSDGAFTVSYPSLRETVGGNVYQRTRYCTYNGSWGAEQAFPNQVGTTSRYWPSGAVLGDNDRVHLFVVKWTLNGTIEVRIRQLTVGQVSDQELPAPATGLSVTYGIMSATGVISSGTTTLLVAYQKFGSPVYLAGLATAQSADAPSWAAEDATTSPWDAYVSNAQYSSGSVIAVKHVAGNRLYWSGRPVVDDPPGNRLFRSIRGTTVWADPETLLWGRPNYPSEAFPNRWNTRYSAISAQLITGGVGMFMSHLYDSNPVTPWYYFDPIASTIGCRYHGF